MAQKQVSLCAGLWVPARAQGTTQGSCCYEHLKGATFAAQQAENKGKAAVNAGVLRLSMRDCCRPLECHVLALQFVTHELVAQPMRSEGPLTFPAKVAGSQQQVLLAGGCLEQRLVQAGQRTATHCGTSCQPWNLKTTATQQ